MHHNHHQFAEQRELPEKFGDSVGQSAAGKQGFFDKRKKKK